MINRGLFENAIRDAKRSKAELADSLGISRQSFYEKVNGVREFKQSEIATLTRILDCDINKDSASYRTASSGYFFKLIVDRWWTYEHQTSSRINGLHSGIPTVGNPRR